MGNFSNFTRRQILPQLLGRNRYNILKMLEVGSFQKIVGCAQLGAFFSRQDCIGCWRYTNLRSGRVREGWLYQLGLRTITNWTNLFGRLHVLRDITTPYEHRDEGVEFGKFSKLILVVVRMFFFDRHAYECQQHTKIQQLFTLQSDSFILSRIAAGFHEKLMTGSTSGDWFMNLMVNPWDICLLYTID